MAGKKNKPDSEASLDWLFDVSDRLESMNLPFVLAVARGSKTIAFANMAGCDPEDGLDSFDEAFRIALKLDTEDDNDETG